MEFQLWAFAAGDDAYTILPQPLSVSASTVLSDTGAMSLVYPLGAPGASLLDTYCDVELRYWDGADWVCPPQGRFTVQDWQTDPVSEWNMPTRTYSLVSWSWLLDSARQFDVSALDSSGMREFINYTPMSVAETLIGEAQAAGFMPTLTVDNQATTTGWAPPYRPGDSVAQILSDARDSGFGEWLFQPDDAGCGRQLTLYDAVGSDLSTGDDPVQVQYTSLGEVTAAPSKRTARGLVTDVLVQGEGGAFVKLHNDAADSPFGRTQGFVSASGITDLDQLRAIGQAVLDGGAVPAVQLTRTVDLTASRWLPLVDYNLGDTILGPDESGALAPLRVREIKIDLAGDRWTATLVLGDKLSERLLDLNRRVRKMQAPYVLGSGAANPAPPIQDNTTPPVSSALTATSKLGTVTLTWNGKDENGNDVSAGFDHAEAERDTSSSFSNPVNVGTFGSRGKIDDAGLTIGATYYYRLVIVNAAGVRAAAGAAVSVTVVGVKGPDLEANSVTANKISVGSLDAISADLGTINAGTVNGIDINGSVITGGVVRSASSGDRITMSPTAASGRPGLSFYDTYYGSEGFFRMSDGTVNITSPNAGGASGVVAWSPNAFTLSLRNNTIMNLVALTQAGNSNITVGGGMSITANGSLNLNGSAVNINGSSAVTGSVVRPGDGISTSSNVSAFRLITTSPRSSSSSSPLYWNSANEVCLLSSSSRFKTDIADSPDPERVLDLRAVEYRYKEDPDGEIQYGLIAEEVVDVYPSLVSFDEDGLPRGVDYARGWVNLLPLVKELWADYKERQHAA